MGGESSKASKLLEGRAEFWQPLKDWTFLAVIPLNEWEFHAASILSFDFEDLCSARGFRISKNLLSDHHLLRKDSNGQERKLGTLPPVCLSDLPPKGSSPCKVSQLSVLASDSKVLVLQATFPHAIKLYILNLLTLQSLGDYSFFSKKEICYQECHISPDSSYFVCRQDFHKRRTLGHVSSFDSKIRVLRILDGVCTRVHLIRDQLIYNTFGSAVCFDPTRNNVLAVFSSERQCDSPDDMGIQCYDLSDCNVIKSAPSFTSHIIRKSVFSPRGDYVAALCVIAHFDLLSLLLDSVQLIDSISLCTNRVIDLHKECCIVSSSNILPMFSRTGQHLAVYTGSESKSVRVYAVPDYNVSLQHLCRLIVLRYTKVYDIPQLSVPKKIWDYLMFKNEGVL